MLRLIMGYYRDIEMNNTFALKDTQTYALLAVPAVLSFFYSLFNEDLSHIEKRAFVEGNKKEKKDELT